MSNLSGALLECSLLSDFEPIGYEGESVWKSAAQVDQILRQRLSPAHAKLFSVPVVDETGNRVNWFAHDKGEYKRWTTLERQDQLRLAKIVEQYAVEIDGVANGLINSKGRDAIMLGERLLGAYYVASARDVFVVNDEPVVANWSMRPLNRPSMPSILPTLSELAHGPEPEPVQNIERADESGNSVWPRILLWLLPLILVLIGVAFWLLSDGSPLGPGANSRLYQTDESLGEALEISAEAVDSGDTSFLEGRWRSTSILVITRTNEPIVVEFEFSLDGLGEKLVIEPNQICQTTVRAEISDGKLIMHDVSEARCPDGQSYVVSTTICTPGEGGPSKCAVLQKGTKQETLVDITRIE